MDDLQYAIIPVVTNMMLSFEWNSTGIYYKLWLLIQPQGVIRQCTMPNINPRQNAFCSKTYAKSIFKLLQTGGRGFAMPLKSQHF